MTAKYFSLFLAKRLKKGLGNIIDEELAGFMQGRNIHNNISLVVDMTDYNRCNSSVKLAYGTTQRFQLQQGLKQECYIFICIGHIRK